jgi:hypothetical protein
MGMIMVIGIAAKNGILLLDADDRLRAHGLSTENAMLQASRRRLRPIVMTALATVAGMLPLAFAIGPDRKCCTCHCRYWRNYCINGLILNYQLSPVDPLLLKP